jgi:hypothetical protein
LRCTSLHTAFQPGAERATFVVTIDGFVLTGRQRMCSRSLIDT